MINVPKALRALASVWLGPAELARELHISPYLVQGWRDGNAISDTSLRMLRGYVGHRLMAHNAGSVYPGWIQDGGALRKAYDSLTPDPDGELVESVRATMRASGSLVDLPSQADRLLAPFRHRNHELHDRIDRAFR